uniref:IMD domain-containing protein n=1 Tax=Haemonchus placei TaxID=6290 RepID=A0A0N4WSE2_HAEPC
LLQQSYPAWEMVGQRAQKLSAQLRATAACIAGFVDSVQAVSDYANNLKGAARDMGVCMTRVCMRERALEHRLRAVADALADETAVSIQQRAAYWKQRTAELDKSAAKHVKKVRTRKGRPDPAAVSEQRQLCSQVLSEQRTQFSFFIGTIMPVFTAEISLLDEGSHIRQVVENLDSTVKFVDGHTLVQTILSDLSQGADNAWRQCLTNAARAYRSGDSGEDGGLSTRATTPGSSFSHGAFLGFIGGRWDSLYSRIEPSGLLQDFLSGNFVWISRSAVFQTPTFCTAPTFRTGSSSCSSSDAASSAALIAETLQQIDQLGSDLESYCHTAVPHRVHTEYAALRTTNGCDPPLATANGHATNTGSNAGGGGSHMQNGVRIRGGGSGEAHVKLPTLAYLDALFVFTPLCLQISYDRQFIGNVGIYKKKFSESASRPPPPTRRTSTITSATPTAPSIAEARMSMGSMMGEYLIFKKIQHLINDYRLMDRNQDKFVIQSESL